MTLPVPAFIEQFLVPLSVLIGILAYLLFSSLGEAAWAFTFVAIAIVVGSFDLIKKTIQDLLAGHFALDYLAILAIAVALLTGEYLVAAIVALMLSSGQTLENYGFNQARRSLTGLTERIPASVQMEVRGKVQKTAIDHIQVNALILVRRGEVVALDGLLQSNAALIDESSLTGEVVAVEKFTGDIIRSGTINLGDLLHVRVTATSANSTYAKILAMVRSAQSEKAPLIRLADRYSLWFTAVSLGIALCAYLYSHNIETVLAVLVLATPCPLILATPIALMGGVNAAAKKHIIIKKLAGLEVLSRVNAMVLDKTGTITLGVPILNAIETATKKMTAKEALSIADSLERNSLHPLAKALTTYAKLHKTFHHTATQVHEEIGKGISGIVENTRYTMAKVNSVSGLNIGLFNKKALLATFRFEDQIKPQSRQTVHDLIKSGIKLAIYTGDKESEARKVIDHLGAHITLKAECTPAAKKEGIDQLKKEGNVVAMVGDGINDAPALAFADVSMVFSNDEQTAASEAADIVFLGSEFNLVKETVRLSQNTIRIALQSIRWGIGLSVLGMILAAFGLIPPIAGAITQEAIDVAVIINALRASRS